jgi:hypothetical protein
MKEEAATAIADSFTALLIKNNNFESAPKEEKNYYFFKFQKQ